MSDRRETLARHLGMIEPGGQWADERDHTGALQWADQIIDLMEGEHV